MSAMDVHRALWRHKVLIAVFTAALVAAVWYVTSRQQPTYEASTLVRVQETVSGPNDVFGALQTGGLLAQTYAEIVGTSKVADAISRQLGGTPPSRTIQRSLSGKQIQDLDLLSISARSHDPATAARIANAAPAALTSFIASTGSLTDEIVVVQPATAPSDPVAPNVQLDLALALVVGLLLNGSLALLVDAFRDRASDPEELERITGQPVLAVIPTLSLRPRPAVSSSDLDFEPPEPAGELVERDVAPLSFRRAAGG